MINNLIYFRDNEKLVFFEKKLILFFFFFYYVTPTLSFTFSVLTLEFYSNAHFGNFNNVHSFLNQVAQIKANIQKTIGENTHQNLILESRKHMKNIQEVQLLKVGAYRKKYPLREFLNYRLQKEVEILFIYLPAIKIQPLLNNFRYMAIFIF